MQGERKRRISGEFSEGETRFHHSCWDTFKSLQPAVCLSELAESWFPLCMRILTVCCAPVKFCSQQILIGGLLDSQVTLGKMSVMEWVQFYRRIRIANII